MPRKDMTASEFIALPDAEKVRIYAALDAETPGRRRARSRPLNERERAEWRGIRKKLGRGRPKLGAQGTEKVSISVEKSLLAAADKYAAKRGLKRSQVFAEGLGLLMRQAV